MFRQEITCYNYLSKSFWSSGKAHGLSLRAIASISSSPNVVGLDGGL